MIMDSDDDWREVLPKRPKVPHSPKLTIKRPNISGISELSSQMSESRNSEFPEANINIVVQNQGGSCRKSKFFSYIQNDAVLKLSPWTQETCAVGSKEKISTPGLDSVRNKLKNMSKTTGKSTTIQPMITGVISVCPDLSVVLESDVNECSPGNDEYSVNDDSPVVA
jgi:hypothetical protein